MVPSWGQRQARGFSHKTWVKIWGGGHTLIDGLADINFANVSDFGVENAVSLGDGKSAYLRSGSLVLQVVPEPSSLLLAGLGGLFAAGSALRRRRR